MFTPRTTLNKSVITRKSYNSEYEKNTFLKDSCKRKILSISFDGNVNFSVNEYPIFAL